MEYLILFLLFLNHGPQYTQNADIQQIKQEKQIDIRVERLELFFKSFNSPFSEYAGKFIEIADREGLDYRLLPTVACVESSCGKNYKLNAFGWASDRVDFGTDIDDIDGIASKISSLSYYKKYKRSGELYDFATAYNGSYAQDYYRKLNWFFRKI